MKKAFITYSHEDSLFVDRLVKELETPSLSVTLDKKILKPGDSLIIKIFDEISNSDFLLPILSENSINSNWVKKELQTAIVKEIDEEDFKVIPIVKEGENWESLKKILPPGLKEVLRDKFLVRFDSKSFEECLPDLIKALTPEEEFAQVHSKIRALSADNPFRRVRTENFESLQILADSFARPEPGRYDKIIEIKPTRIEGGRGSGKTMILKSMIAQVCAYRMRKRSFRETNLPYYGIYCRLTQGSFATQAGNILDHITENQASILFLTEFNFQLINSLIDEISSCSDKNILDISTKLEVELSQNIGKQIYSGQAITTINSFVDLKEAIQKELGILNDYLSRKILGETGKYPGVFISKDKLRAVCRTIINTISDLNGKTIYFLLDEYENLISFQKVVVNTLVKWSEQGYFSIKISSKKTGFKNPQTLERQEIEEGHDYNRIDLDYDLSKATHRTFYKRLLIDICQRTLKNEGFTETYIEKILETRSPFSGLESEIEEMIDQMLQMQKNVNFSSLDKSEQIEIKKRLEIGALYRVLAKKHKRRQFSGFDDLMILSSGIIRYFLELCGTSYYFAVQDNVDVKSGKPIKIQHQSDAVYALSSFYLYNIRKNLVQYGSDIHRLVIDLGDIFRAKTLNHLTEPESARISISDPQSLSEKSHEKITKILDLAEMHSVMQTFVGIGGIRPKHASNVQPKEYILNRIYSPVLQFSPKYRWRTSFSIDDLEGLINPDARELIKAKLIQKVSPVPKKSRKIKSQKTLTF
ncbi:MAG: toll/interleukin-1 receptor domain-containing protein [Methanoregula sp.]|jgi:hypothetical protein|uniref:toll/interleukin-1 receptor domain-containing protein n=1 Tax=Methanoregula sp. TaxID=2052170 RepID=UPI003D10EFAA